MTGWEGLWLKLKAERDALERRVLAAEAALADLYDDRRAESAMAAEERARCVDLVRIHERLAAEEMVRSRGQVARHGAQAVREAMWNLGKLMVGAPDPAPPGALLALLHEAREALRPLADAYQAVDDETMFLVRNGDARRATEILQAIAAASAPPDRR